MTLGSDETWCSVRWLRRSARAALLVWCVASGPAGLRAAHAADVPPPADPLTNPPTAARESSTLTAIDLPLDSLPLLERLGILHQSEPRLGFWRAAASVEQLALLRQAGVAYTVAGNVAIVEGGSNVPSAPSYGFTCYGSNSGDYPIPQTDPYDYVYDPIWTNCPGATTVNYIDVYYDVIHPWADTALYLNVGSNSPSWAYRTLEFAESCTPPAAPDWHKFQYNITEFNGGVPITGRPVNQRWDLAVRDDCPGGPTGYIDYWAIWVYYTAPACMGPVPIPPLGGVFTGTTVGTNTLTGTCARTEGPEQVFSWTPNRSGTATIETCGGSTNFDTVLYVRSGDCTSGTEVACNDDLAACAPGSRVTLTVTAGQTYYIVVDGYGGASGNFTLTVTPPGPSLGACDLARPIPPLGGVFTGTTAGPSWLEGGCTRIEAAPEQVFRWTPDRSGTAAIETCGGSTSYDTVLYVRSGSCDSGTEVACNDDFADCSPASRVTFMVTAGQTYYIVVDGFGGASGNFTLTVTPPAPCESPIQIPAQGGTFAGMTLGTSTLTPSCGGGAASPEQVFRWTPSSSGTAIIETCGEQTDFDTVLYLRTDCQSGPDIACNDDACANAMGLNRASRLTPTVTAGQTYYIVVDGYGSARGNFALSVIPPNAPPACPAWSAVASYPIPISENAVAAQGSRLYSFGGASSGAATTSSYKYDPLANSWTPIAPLPVARREPSAVSDGTYVYILGGWDTNHNYTNTLYRYDPLGDRYALMAPFSVPTAAQAAVYYDGKIYRIGGCAAGTCDFTYTVEAYSSSSNTWVPVANYPADAAWNMVTRVNGLLFGAGGLLAGNKTYSYDPALDAWDDASIADLPASRLGGASGFRKNQWLLAGGFAGGDVLFVISDVIAWDPVANTWSYLAPMLFPRAAGGAVVGSAFYVVGGQPLFFQDFPESTEVQRYDDMPCATPTFTSTRTATATATRTATRTNTPTATMTRTNTPSNTPTATRTRTPTTTPTRTPTGSPTRTPTRTPTGPLYTVSGHVRHYSSALAVEGVEVHMNPPSTPVPVTGVDGAFTVTGLGEANCTLTPHMHGKLNGAITTLDAVYVLQAVVGMRQLSAMQQLACDTSGSGSITTIDAVYILQDVVGLITSLPVAQLCNSDWVFMPTPGPAAHQRLIQPQLGGGSCQAGAIALEPVVSDATNQDFSAALFGDCSGNWQRSLGAAAAVSPSLSPAPARLGAARRGRGGRVRFPLLVDGPAPFQALEARITYDPASLRLVAVRRATVARQALVQYNATVPGEVRLAMASAEPIASDGAPVLVFDFEQLRAERLARPRMHGAWAGIAR